MVTLATTSYNLNEYDNARNLAEKALKLDSENKVAKYIIGILNLKGFTTPVNYTNAKKHLEISAKQKYPDSMNALGIMHLNGLGVIQNNDIALSYFLNASKLDNPSAHFNLFSAQYNKFGRIPTALKEYLVKAYYGNVLHSMYNLGIIYSYGVGGMHKCESGTDYLRMALNVMVNEKYFNDSYLLYNKGQVKVATIQYMIMGESLHTFSQFNAANILDSYNIFNENLWIHQYLPNLDINKKMALNYYLKSYKYYSTYSNLRIGDFYYYGKGVEENIDTATQYYDLSRRKVSTKEIYAFSLFNYGVQLQYGIGMEKDLLNALIAYNNSVLFDPIFSIPSKLAIATLDLRGTIMSKIYVIPLLISISFLGGILYLIYKRP